MICPRRNHHLFLFYCLFVLVHVRQTVNSLQNGYYRHPEGTHHRYGHNPLPPRHPKESSSQVVGFKRNEPVNGIRGIEERGHHLRHQHNHHLHRHQYPSSGLNSLRNEGLYRPHPSAASSSSPQPSGYRSSNRRIEEAVHAFQTSTTAQPTESYGHYPHHYHRNNQPPHNHPSAHHSLSLNRPTQHSINPQTPRPRPDDDSVESHTKSLSLAGSRHLGSSVINDFATTLPSVGKVDPAQRLAHPGRNGARANSQHNQLHVKHSDASQDDDEYYYYEDDNDSDDDDKSGDDNGHANEYVDNSENMEEDEMPRKETTDGFATNYDSSFYARPLYQHSTIDYDDEESLQADEPSDSGSLTQQKWRDFSTREGVERMAVAENPSIAASAHLKRINQEGKCEYPKPKVISISNNTSKRFIPHCTVLHRCGDDTGCCWSDTKTCVAKKTASVVLYFYVIPLGQTATVIEPLSLINHTECHCVDRSLVRTSTVSSVYEAVTSPERHTQRCVTYFDLDERDPDYVRCDCMTRDAGKRAICERLAKGEEGFLLEDQRCVTQGRCKPPTCEYGQYNRTRGRCPSKEHKFIIAKNINQPFH